MQQTNSILMSIHQQPNMEEKGQSAHINQYYMLISVHRYYNKFNDDRLPPNTEEYIKEFHQLIERIKKRQLFLLYFTERNTKLQL
jgi:hypothetical protein